MFICKHCNKECKNKNSLSNHQIRCKVNPDRITSKPSYGMLGKKGRNQYQKAKDLGLPPPVVSDETRKKLSISAKQQVWSEEQKLKHSQTMKQVVKDNPDSYTASNVCGRVKIYEYGGEKLHGTWELEVAKWLDFNGIMWQRKSITSFEYMWNGTMHRYFPDFYLPELNFYIEVKGYETDRDRCKWSVVPNLIVIKDKQINLIKQNKFALITH